MPCTGDDSLELRRTKTNEGVTTALPHDVADELRMHQRMPGYSFTPHIFLIVQA
jgi:hypothetical protein